MNIFRKEVQTVKRIESWIEKSERNGRELATLGNLIWAVGTVMVIAASIIRRKKSRTQDDLSDFR